MYEVSSVDNLLSWVYIHPVSQSLVWMVKERRTGAEKCLRTGLEFSYLDLGRWKSLKANG